MRLVRHNLLTWTARQLISRAANLLQAARFLRSLGLKLVSEWFMALSSAFLDVAALCVRSAKKINHEMKRA